MACAVTLVEDTCKGRRNKLPIYFRNTGTTGVLTTLREGGQKLEEEAEQKLFKDLLAGKIMSTHGRFWRHRSLIQLREMQWIPPEGFCSQGEVVEAAECS